MNEWEVEATFQLENPKRRDHLGNLAVDGDMVLKRIIFK
jgi:hypothetical protein